MARKELSVEPRHVLGKKVAQLRRQGVLPANIYGHGISSVSVQVSEAALHKTLKAAEANEVIDLRLAGERVRRPAVIHHLQRDPLTGSIIHADFYQVSLREKMRADIPLVLTGHSEAVATFQGVLLPGADSLHVEGLPLDIPAQIEVDISPLTELEMTIHVRDLTLPRNITLLTDPDVVVAKVASPRVIEEKEEEEEREAEEAPAPAPEQGAAPAEEQAEA